MCSLHIWYTHICVNFAFVSGNFSVCVLRAIVCRFFFFSLLFCLFRFSSLSSSYLSLRCMSVFCLCFEERMHRKADISDSMCVRIYEWCDDVTDLRYKSWEEMIKKKHLQLITTTSHKRSIHILFLFDATMVTPFWCCALVRNSFNLLPIWFFSFSIMIKLSLLT